MRTHGQIDLLRHGETVGGACFNGSTDVPLSAEGWRQLVRAVEQSGRDWDRIISSPLSRCANFAESVSKKMNLPWSVDSRFREMHFGAWEGRSPAELMASDPDALGRFWSNPMEYIPPQAEPLKLFQKRVLRAWHEMLGKYPGEDILLVTHGGVIRLVLCHVRQHPVERLLEIEAAHAVLHPVQTSALGDRFGCCIYGAGEGSTS